MINLQHKQNYVLCIILIIKWCHFPIPLSIPILILLSLSHPHPHPFSFSRLSSCSSSNSQNTTVFNYFNNSVNIYLLTVLIKTKYSKIVCSTSQMRCLIQFETFTQTIWLDFYFRNFATQFMHSVRTFTWRDIFSVAYMHNSAHRTQTHPHKVENIVWTVKFFR